MSRVSVTVSVVLMAVGCFGACASKSSSSAGTTTTAQPDSGTCTRECCELPQPGAACSSDAGATCTYAVTCPEGLVLSRTTECQAGVWKATNDCPVAGGSDARGCPATQPTNGTPCTPDPMRGSTQCGYTKTCGTKVCDGGDCVPVRTSAQATCVNGMWQTTPLGPC